MNYKFNKQKYSYGDKGPTEYRNTAGQLHRENGPAVEYEDGSTEWYLDGKRHRIDGPAIEWSSGHKEWWVSGKLHRLDGPAIEWADGSKRWCVNGKRVAEVECKLLHDIMKLKGLL